MVSGQMFASCRVAVFTSPDRPASRLAFSREKKTATWRSMGLASPDEGKALPQNMRALSRHKTSQTPLEITSYCRPVDQNRQLPSCSCTAHHTSALSDLEVTAVAAEQTQYRMNESHPDAAGYEEGEQHSPPGVQPLEGESPPGRYDDEFDLDQREQPPPVRCFPGPTRTTSGPQAYMHHAG